MRTHHWILWFLGGGVAAAMLVAQPPGELPGPAPTQKKHRAQPPAATRARPAADKTTPSQAPVLGHVETRDRVVTIQAGSQGPVYTVRSKEGRLLYERLSGKELQAKAPALYEVVKTGFAHAPGQGAAQVDASLRVPVAVGAGR